MCLTKLELVGGQYFIYLSRRLHFGLDCELVGSNIQTLLKKHLNSLVVNIPLFIQDYILD